LPRGEAALDSFERVGDQALPAAALSDSAVLWRCRADQG
jgi:hypothetical protein